MTILSGKHRSHHIIIAVTAGLTIALAGCGGSNDGGSGSDSISIAIVSDQTGFSAAIQGLSSTNGALTAIDAANRAGGIEGKKIQTKIYDGASTAGPAQTAARSAIADQPRLILNMSGSITTNAAFPLFQQSTVPVLSVANGAEQVMPPQKFFWGFNSSADQVAGYLQQAATRVLGGIQGKRVVWEAVQSPGADAFLKVAQPKFQASGAITVDTIRVEGTLDSFASQAAKVVSANADIFIPIDGAGNMTTMGKALATAGYKGPIVGGGDSLSDEAVFSALNNPNFHAARVYQPPLEGSEMHAQAMAAGIDITGGYFGAGYTAAQAAIAALKKCGETCDADALADSIDGLGEFEPDGGSASGPLRFGKNRRAVAYSIASMTWDSGAGKAVQSGDLIQIENPVGDIK